MFNSAIFFRIASDFVLPPLESMESALQAAQFVPCGATQPKSSGWIPPRGKKSTVMAEVVGGQLILRLQTERRQVPVSAIDDAVEVMTEKYKQETGRERVGAKIKKEFKEETLLQLLPRAFPVRSSVTLWLDPARSTLAVDSSNLTGADKAVGLLIEVLSGMEACPAIMARPLQTSMSPQAAMAEWLSSQNPPMDFSIDRDCELKTPDDQKSAVRYSCHTLEINEVIEHIQAGKLPTQLAMTWSERVSFVLTDMAQLKKIKLLDVVLDGQQQNEADDGFDADVAIITGELSGLIPDLIEALGGELAAC